MLNKFKKYIPILSLIVLVIFIYLFVVVPFILEDTAFVIGYDVRNQYRPWFTEFRLLLKNAISQKTLPFWSWNMFFGNNVWASKAYYFVADIYTYISMFFSTHYYNILMLITGLKLIISALSFYAYGSVREWKISTKLVGALLFAFSAWSLKYVEHPFFLSFYSFVPLYFMGIELYFKNKFKFLFPIFVSLLLLQNYYLFYTISVFTIIYYIYRYFELHYDLKHFIKKTLILIAYYLVGVFITSIIIVPSALFILQSSRVFNTGSNLLFYENIRVYFHMMISWVIPSSTFLSKIVLKDGVEAYASIYEPLTYQTRELMLWSGSIVALLLPQVFFDKQNKTINRFLYTILIVILVIPFGGSILHGFSEPSFRWTMLFIFMNIILVLPFIDDIDRINLKVLNFSLAIIFVLVLLNLPLLSLILNENIKDYLGQYLLFFVSLGFIAANYYIIVKKPKWFVNGILFLVVAELCFVSYFTFNDSPSYKKFTWEYVNNFEKVLGENYNELNYYLEGFDSDRSLYRVYAPFDSVYWYMSLNTNLIHNFSEVKTYDSTYQFSNDDLLKIVDMPRGLGWSWNITQSDIIDYVSVKYAIVTDISQLPHKDFEYVGNFRGLLVYKNLNYNTLLRTQNNVMGYSSYSKINDPSIINTHILVEDLYVEEINKLINNTNNVSVENIEMYQNMLIGEINTVGDSFVVSSIAYDKGWRIFVNDEQVKSYKVNGGFIGFSVPSGTSKIKLYFMPEGFKQGFIISAIGFIAWLLLFFSEYKKIKWFKKNA